MLKTFTPQSRKKCINNVYVTTNRLTKKHKHKHTSFLTPYRVVTLVENSFKQFFSVFFTQRYILEQHKHVHRHQIETKRFPCQIQNCLYVARNTSDEQSHLLTHSDERLFYCEHSGCEYQGKTMEQLRR